VVDHALSAQMQRLTKSKISYLFSWLLSLAHQFFIFGQETSQRAFYCIRFTHPGPFNEMFIFNGKFHCCNNTLLTSSFIAVSKEHLTNGQNICRYLELEFLLLHGLKFSLKLVSSLSPIIFTCLWIKFHGLNIMCVICVRVFVCCPACHLMLVIAFVSDEIKASSLLNISNGKMVNW